MEPYIDILLVNTTLCAERYLDKHCLTAEDLPRNFKLSEVTVFPQFRVNKYDFFDWGLPGANANLLDNVVHNPESKISGSAFLFEVCFMQFYLVILNTTLLTYIVVLTWVSHLKLLFNLA